MTIYLFAVALILGSLGYLEKILGWTFTRRTHWIIMFIFIAVSFGQYLSSTEEIETLQENIDTEKSKIRSFESKISVIFSGNWSGGVGSIPFWQDSPGLVFSTKDEQKTAIFYTTIPFSIKDIDNTHARYESVQAIHPGEYPLGYQISELSRIKGVHYSIPFIGNRMEKNKIITVELEEIEFFINGEFFGKIVNREKYSGEVFFQKGSYYFSVSKYLKREGLYEYFTNHKNE